MIGEHVDAFEASVNRCLESPTFIRDFYDRFTGSSDAIREKFRNTDFERQNRALAGSLHVMAVAVRGGPGNIARLELERLARRHKEMDISASMYDVWLDCVLQSARTHDPRFSPAVERAWRETLGPGIEYMRTGAPFEA
jgi:hemoglobin-like flavoprotein